MSRLPDDPVARAFHALGLGQTAFTWIGSALRPASVLTAMLIGAALLPVSWVTTTPSLCPFKLVTGLPCPGCGMTRSVVTLMHGDLTASLYFHPLGIMLVGLCLGLIVLDGWVWLRPAINGAPSKSASWLPERLMRTPAPWAAIAMLALVWLVRLPLYLAGSWVF